MTDTDHALDLVARAATELLPELTERLARHGLAEVEVSDGDLRMRVRGGAAPASSPLPEVPGAVPSEVAPSATAEAAGEQDGRQPDAVGVGSPAVGFFVYAEGLGPGLEVDKGDPVGHVEMLGVRHEVRVPRAGVVRSLVAESGEAVEYGQVVVELEPGSVSR